MTAAASVRSNGATFPTSFCRLLGLSAPVVQAPVGSAATPELAAAVSNAGGLGMLALTWTPRDVIRARLRETRGLTDRPIGVNLVLEWDQHERVAACVAESVPAGSSPENRERSSSESSSCLTRSACARAPLSSRSFWVRFRKLSYSAARRR